MARIPLSRPFLPDSEPERFETLSRMSTSRLLGSAGLFLVGEHAEILGRHGLAVTDYEVLNFLAGHDEQQTLGQVATGAALGAPTVTTVSHRLCQRGLAERLDNPVDRRGAWLRLTDAGRALHGELRSEMLQVDDEIASILSPQTLRAMRDGLSTVLTRLVPQSDGSKTGSVDSAVCGTMDADPSERTSP